MSKVTSVRLDDDLSDKVDALAASMDRSKTWIIEQAIKSYVEEQSWQVRAIRDALQDYRSGKAALTPHDQVAKELKKLESEVRP